MLLACGGGVPVGRPAHAHGWCPRVVPTGGAHGLAGGTLRARNNAARCTRRCPPDRRGIIWELQWRTKSVRQRLCACVGEGCAARSESQWLRAPTLTVARVGPLAGGVQQGVARAPGRISKTHGPGGRRTDRPLHEWRRGGNQQSDGVPRMPGGGGRGRRRQVAHHVIARGSGGAPGYSVNASRDPS